MGRFLVHVMRRRSSSRIPRRFRRSKAFVLANILVWAGLGLWYALQPSERQADVARLVRNALDGDKEVTAFDVAWDVWQFYARTDTVPAWTSGDRSHFYAGVPRASQPLRVLTNIGYAVGYSEHAGLPLWAAYHVSDRDFGALPPRPEAFGVDRRTRVRVEPDDYARSGYDRGHLAPSFAIALHHGREAQEETFLMSNIAPQRHALNAGPWHALERRIARNYPARFAEVWVVAGPILGSQPARLRGRVALPEAFFMMMIDEREGRVRAQAFILPQEAPPDAAAADFLTSIDEVERRSGLDVLHELPDDAEAILESVRAARPW